MNFIFRVDASKTIGGGHLSRCLSLIKSIEVREKCNIHFISNNFENLLSNKLAEIKYKIFNPKTNFNSFDYQLDAEKTIGYINKLETSNTYIIVDHYKIDSKWERLIKPYCNKIIVIDDLANRRHICDILVDQNLVKNYKNRYQYLVSKNCKLLLGPKYALIGKEYSNNKNNYYNQKKDEILIFFGSFDKYGLTLKILNLLIKINIKKNINVVINTKVIDYQLINKISKVHQNIKIYSNLDSLHSLLSKANIVIGSMGINFWERCTFGIKSILISTSYEQIPIANYLDKNNFATYLGHFDSFSNNHFINLIKSKSLVANKYESKLLTKLVDGKGPLRVFDYIYPQNKKIRSRKLNYDDIHILYRWANNTLIRKNSFHNKYINLKTHKSWFKSNFTKNTTIYFYETYLNNEIGIVRFTKKKSIHYIHFNIEPALFSLGYGLKIVKLSLSNFMRKNKTKVYGKVLNKNMSSKKIFEKLNFDKKVLNNCILYSKEFN